MEGRCAMAKVDYGNFDKPENLAMDYASDDLVLRSSFEKFLCRFSFPKFILRKIRRISRIRYGTRNDLMRAVIRGNTGIYVGKYSYGFEHLCFKDSPLV